MELWLLFENTQLKMAIYLTDPTFNLGIKKTQKKIIIQFNFFSFSFILSCFCFAGALRCGTEKRSYNLCKGTMNYTTVHRRDTRTFSETFLTMASTERVNWWTSWMGSPPKHENAWKEELSSLSTISPRTKPTGT